MKTFIFAFLFTTCIFTKALDNNVAESRDARLGEFPYQLSLQFLNQHFCGASLASVNGQQVAITAAHCMEEYLTEYIRIVAGDLELDRVSRREQTRNIAMVITHPNYSRTTLENDIALIFPNTPFDLNFNVQPISLPAPFQTTADNIVVTGWGDRDATGESTERHLQATTLPVLNDSICQNQLGTTFDSILCIGPGSETLAACHGDGGGPAKSSSGHLVGIVSYANAFGCRLPGEPDVFTEISHFVDWIEEQVPIQPTTDDYNIWYSDYVIDS